MLWAVAVAEAVAVVVAVAVFMVPSKLLFRGDVGKRCQGCSGSLQPPL